MITSPSDRGRILIVDDDDKILDLLVELLTEEGYEVAGARNGSEGLDLAFTFAPDVVISDIRLGDDGPDGLELMRELRRRYGVQGIAVSGHAMDDHVLRDAGFVAYLLKPILFDRLLDTVEAVCAATTAVS